MLLILSPQTSASQSASEGFAPVARPISEKKHYDVYLEPRLKMKEKTKIENVNPDDRELIDNVNPENGAMRKALMDESNTGPHVKKRATMGGTTFIEPVTIAQSHSGDEESADANVTTDGTKTNNATDGAVSTSKNRTTIADVIVPKGQRRTAPRLSPRKLSPHKDSKLSPHSANHLVGEPRLPAHSANHVVVDPRVSPRSANHVVVDPRVSPRYTNHLVGRRHTFPEVQIASKEKTGNSRRVTARETMSEPPNMPSDSEAWNSESDFRN